jgi:Protein of unknown function (DUF2855)
MTIAIISFRPSWQIICAGTAQRWAETPLTLCGCARGYKRNKKMTITRLLVNRAAIDQTKVATVDIPALNEGEVLVKVGEFAVTANNITYALSGDMIGYWKFFPVDGDEWGIVPVWGFGEVTDSRCDGVPVGERFWGFLPMASHVVMKPVRIRGGGFVDGAEHRQALPVIYNDYVRTADDAPELAALSDSRSLLFPLLTTSYLIADYLSDNDCFGADQIIIGSASSKTGFGTAHYLRQLEKRPARITGLTSAANVVFTQSLGLYDQVIAYSDVPLLDAADRSVYVDMSGDGAVLNAVHSHFVDQLMASIGVGATHWKAPRGQAMLPGAKPEFFFAPSQIVKRNAQWGAGVLMRKVQAANIAFASGLGDHLTIVRDQGAEAVKGAYEAMVSGATAPTQGLILAF